MLVRRCDQDGKCEGDDLSFLSFLFSFLLYLNLDTFAWYNNACGIIKSFSILDLQGAHGEREDEGETSPRDIAFRYSLILFVGQSLSFGVP